MRILYHLIFFFVIILYIISCGQTLSLVFEEGVTQPPIIISVAEPPDSVTTKGTQVKIDYDWNRSRQAFELRQNASESIKYTITPGMFGGGKHEYDWAQKISNMGDHGRITFFVVNKFGDGYAYGKGRLMYHIHCTYKDQNGNKHSGAVSNYLVLPVIFSQY
ncbi:MAG: hypothetical protein V3U16_03440 [Candidatus Neomarinimicrobiota bacterium]